MGYGYPAALGAKVAFPDRQVVDIDGDGSFLMNIQELATAHIEKIAAKAIILNNQHLGMVMQWEDRFYAGNRGNTYLGDPENRKQIYPDYTAVCNSFNVKCERVMYKKDLRGGDAAHARRQRAVRAGHHRALYRARAAVHPGGPDGRRHDLAGVGKSRRARIGPADSDSIHPPALMQVGVGGLPLTIPSPSEGERASQGGRNCQAGRFSRARMPGAAEAIPGVPVPARRAVLVSARAFSPAL